MKRRSRAEERREPGGNAKQTGRLLLGVAAANAALLIAGTAGPPLDLVAGCFGGSWLGHSFARPFTRSGHTAPANLTDTWQTRVHAGAIRESGASRTRSSP